MATRLWKGGASKTAQVDTLTLGGTWETDDILKTTLTDEGGTGTTITTDPAGSTTIQTIRDTHLTALQAATASDFNKVTFASSGTDKITVTADTAGIPFHCTVVTTEAGGGAADSQTYARAATTASSGPNDWGVAANWSGSTVPVNNDIVNVAFGTFFILYTLDQSAVNLQHLRIGEGFTGNIGDIANNFNLKVDVSNSTTTAPILVFNGRGQGCRIEGQIDHTIVKGGKASQDMLHLKIDDPSAVVNVRILGSKVAGTVNIIDASVIDNLYLNDCPGATVKIGTSINSWTLLEMNSGHVETKSLEHDSGDRLVVNVSGGRLIVHEDTDGEDAKNVTVRGGIVEWNCDGTIGQSGSNGVTVHGGAFVLNNNASTLLTIRNVTVDGGAFIDDSGLNNIAYTNNIIKFGGQVIEPASVTVTYT